jgi:hypothetical protein
VDDEKKLPLCQYGIEQNRFLASWRISAPPLGLALSGRVLVALAFLALRLREGVSFVQAWVVQQIVTGGVLPRRGGHSDCFGHLTAPRYVVPRDSSTRTRPPPPIATWVLGANPFSLRSLLGRLD